MDDCQWWDKAACHDQTKSQTNHRKRRRLPPFWTSNPKAWFKRAETFFHTCGVNSNDEKFDNVVTTLKEMTAIDVQEFIVNPMKDGGKYDAIKTALEPECRNESGHIRMVRMQTDQNVEISKLEDCEKAPASQDLTDIITSGSSDEKYISPDLLTAEAVYVRRNTE